MKLNMNLPKLLFMLFILIGTSTFYAQSCKQAFYSAKEQYNGGQFESAQNLLNDCIKDILATKASYRRNPDLVFKVYKLYMAACTKNRNGALADKKRQELITIFSNKNETEVLERLKQTKI